MVRGPNGQTRRRILDIALELFAGKGYDRTSLREIAERLGFSKAALYYHFRAKEDILCALAGTLFDEVDRIARSALDSGDRSTARRIAMLSELVDLLLAHRETAELFLTSQPTLAHTDLGIRANEAICLAQRAMLPERPTPEDRIRAAAALAIIQSALFNLSDLSAEPLPDLVLELAAFALSSDADAAKAIIDRLRRRTSDIGDPATRSGDLAPS